MQHRNKSFYFEAKLVQTHKNPKELWRTFKCFSLNAKEGNTTKISLTEYGTNLGKTQTFSNSFTPS